ncbi:type II toxin-antitoxin system HicB family antitoxin [Aequorivita viscosa]|uniref:Predicted nuclease of the RNAse H fold, HicB family n=1 Tax=Aequorivita viscosa TaxID=797419 RepID=A0A1M6M1F0_9FLAO|nr:type II toxin-antitoxin system HicB family antitoxin [Aequorivita viscosa]SDX31651.1 Predicted nuclease of the RNAse H fold, HicB family [Aequorivita viscosa]SHJ77163.1 Predicted nuclease of the RNAse H fold, HicB family [Aequorivita viscosa]
MGIKVKVEKSADGVYWGTTQNIPGVVTADGKDLNALKENLKEALELYLETAQDIDDKKILQLLSEGISFEYHLELSELFNKLKVINKSAFANRIGISPSLLRQYSVNKDIYISEERAKKIERELHSLGQELQSIRL